MVKAITSLEGNEWSAKSSMYHNHDTSPCKSHKFCHRKDAIFFSRSYCAFLNSLDRILMVLNFVFSKKPAILGQLIKTVTLERSLRQTKPNSTNSRQNLDICHLIRKCSLPERKIFMWLTSFNYLKNGQQNIIYQYFLFHYLSEKTRP